MTGNIISHISLDSLGLHLISKKLFSTRDCEFGCKGRLL